jgi:hypothetical protein
VRSSALPAVFDVYPIRYSLRKRARALELAHAILNAVNGSKDALPDPAY